MPNNTDRQIEGQIIRIVFEDFRLEKSPGCENDWLQIENSSNILLDKACGDIEDLAMANKTVIDSPSPMTVTFNTDASGRDKGFKFSWYTGGEGGSEAAITTTTTKPEVDNKFCGGTLTEMDCCGADLDRQCGYGQGDCDADEQCAGDLK